MSSKSISKIQESTLERKRWEDYDTIKCLDGEVIDMQKLIQEQGKARAALIHLEPMFSAFAPKLVIVYTFHIETQATDGYHLFVNPQFTAHLSFEEKVFVMAHECMHCVLDHMRRGTQAGHDPMKANIAADYEVNQTLVELGLFKESTIKHIGALINPKYTNWSYDRIYADNPSGPTQNNNNSQSGDSSGNGGQSNKNSQGGSQNKNQSSNNQSNNNSQSDSGSSNSNSQGGSQSKNQSGSGSSNSNSQGGNQGEVTLADCAGQFGNNTPNTPGGFCGVGEGNKLADEEGYEQGPSSDDAISASWKETAIQAAQKKAGKNAGSFVSKIMGIWKTTTDWKKAFRKIIGKSLNTTDRRSAWAQKNALVSQNRLARTDKDKFDCVDYISIFTDSSGSITDKDLQYMLSEIYAITYQLKPETLVVGQFDTKIQDVQTFGDLNQFKKYTAQAVVKGRGGTECKCIWDLLKTDKKFKGNPCELVIIMTDGYLTQYKRDPKTMQHLCWVIIDNASWELDYKDAKTFCVHLNSSDIKNR